MAVLSFNESQIRDHQVFNELDRHGLALDLPRLPKERNAEYKHRLLDIFVNKANSAYMGLLNGITRELGLSFRDEFTITPTSVETFPNCAIVFKDTRCCIYEDYYSDPVKEIDRWSLGGGAYTLLELKEQIESTGLFTVQNMPGIDLSQRSMTIFDQNSLKTKARESLSGKGHIINLDNNGLIADSEYIYSQILTTKLDSADNTLLSDFKKGQYRIDYTAGKISCSQTPAAGSYIRYAYRDDNFIVRSTPVIISNLQTRQFQKLLFEQIEQLDENGTLNGLYENGTPTVFGADIINELLSVYPTTYKE